MMKRLFIVLAVALMPASMAMAEPKLEFTLGVEGPKGMPVAFKGYWYFREIASAQFRTVDRPINLKLPWSTFSEMTRFCLVSLSDQAWFVEDDGTRVRSICEDVNAPRNVPADAEISAAYRQKIYSN